MGGFLDWLSGRQTADSPEMAAAVDCLIKTIDPRLAAVSGALAELAPVVENALAFCRRAAEEIPGPLDASSAHWRDAPLLCALFARNEDLQQTFSRQDAVRDYLDEQPLVTRFYALLGAACEERKNFGVALENETLRSDVAITSLNFARHRLFLPRAAEDVFARDLTAALFRQLALEILHQLARMKEEAAERREEIAFLRAQLACHGQGGLGEILTLAAPEEVADEAADEKADAEENADTSAAPGALWRQLEESLAALKARNEPLQDLENTLRWVIERLADPARLLNAQTLRYRINRVNQVVADDQPGLDLCFCHFSVHAPTPRQGVLLRVVYPVEELLPRRRIAAQRGQLI
jgi:hypothetical protein